MRLNLDDAIVDFTIEGYKKSSVLNWTQEWCNIKLKVASRYINFVEEGNLLLSREIETLYDRVSLLLSGGLSRREHIFFAAPNLEFRLRPAALTEDGEADIDMFMIINLRDNDDTVTANSLHLLMDRDSIEKLYYYLHDTIKAATVRKRVSYTFEYWVDFGNGKHTRLQDWKCEVSEDEAALLDEVKARNGDLSGVSGLEKVLSGVESRIKEIEADNIRDSELWGEENFNKYGTDDPFKVYKLGLRIKR